MNFAIKIAKLNIVVDIEAEKLPPTSLEYAIEYGLTQSLNDVHSSVLKKDYVDKPEEYAAAVRAKVDGRLEQLMSGNVPGRKGPADPNAKVARELAKAMADDAELAAVIEAARAKHNAKKMAKAA